MKRFVTLLSLLALCAQAVPAHEHGHRAARQDWMKTLRRQLSHSLPGVVFG